jgi:hypothetical protein
MSEIEGLAVQIPPEMIHNWGSFPLWGRSFCHARREPNE